MKKIIVTLIVAAITFIYCYCADSAPVDNNYYSVKAQVERMNDEIIFAINENLFVWELAASDTVPKSTTAILLIDNNGTPDILNDDIIISYQ